MPTPAGLSIFHQDGILLDPHTIALADAFNDEPDGSASQLDLLNAGAWLSFDIPTDRIVTLATTGQTMYAVGRAGLFLRVALPLPRDRADVIPRISMAVIKDVHQTGELTRCRAVGKAAFAVGQCGQVYRLTEQGFDDFSFGLRGDGGPDFEDVGGVSESLLYACGIGGTVFRFDGRRWKQLDSPTDANLSGVLVESESSVYFCGDGGTLLHLRDDHWSTFDSDPDRNYWDICRYRETPVLAHVSGLDLFDGQSFKALDPSPEPDNTFYRLHALGDQLLSTGPDDLFLVSPRGVQPIAVPGRP